VTTPVGAEITAWKWLRAMCEHEAHHRGQLSLYLRLLGVDPPSIFGHKAEAVGEAILRERGGASPSASPGAPSPR